VFSPRPALLEVDEAAEAVGDPHLVIFLVYRDNLQTSEQSL